MRWSILTSSKNQLEESSKSIRSASAAAAAATSALSTVTVQTEQAMAAPQLTAEERISLRFADLYLQSYCLSHKRRLKREFEGFDQENPTSSTSSTSSISSLMSHSEGCSLENSPLSSPAVSRMSSLSSLCEMDTRLSLSSASSLTPSASSTASYSSQDESLMCQNNYKAMKLDRAVSADYSQPQHHVLILPPYFRPPPEMNLDINKYDDFSIDIEQEKQTDIEIDQEIFNEEFIELTNGQEQDLLLWFDSMNDKL